MYFLIRLPRVPLGGGRRRPVCLRFWERGPRALGMVVSDNERRFSFLFSTSDALALSGIFFNCSSL